MEILKKYYIYILEFFIGNVLFNFVFSISKTYILKYIGAESEKYLLNFKNSFKETFVFYLIMFLIFAIAQILYDKAIVDLLNKKLKKVNKRGDESEK